MISIFHYHSPIGGITVSGNGREITGLWFDGQKYFGATLPDQYEEKMTPVFEEAETWLNLYFNGTKPDFTPPLSIATTPFRKTVWKILLAIPYGQTMTYGEIADRITAKTGLATMSAQAVGGAVGHNPISLMAPCHRVVGANGSLTGYAAGNILDPLPFRLQPSSIVFNQAQHRHQRRCQVDNRKKGIAGVF